jgi:outer membrane murein-binding lipoprotein Lpp
MSDDPPIMTAATRKQGWQIIAIPGIIAFLAGLAAMALVLRSYDRWFGARPVATVTLPLAGGGAGQATPVVIVPGTGTAAAPAIDLDALSRRESELAARLADLETRVASVGNDARAASGYATRAEGLMVAFAARRALDRGLGLGYVENQLRIRFGASQPRAVATILQAAREPMTVEDLRVGLDGIAPELATGSASGWWTSFRRELSNLVVLHEAGTPSPLPADRLARARRMLEAGQVEPALAEVARTPGAAQAGRWTSAARRYIDARQALDVIESAAILGQSGAVAAPVPARPDVPGMGSTPPHH